MADFNTLEAAAAAYNIPTPPQIISDCNIHRYGKHKEHWYVDYGGSGCVGTYKGGFSKSTYHQSGEGLSKQQQRDLSDKIRLSRARQKAELEAKHAAAAHDAAQQWNTLSVSGVSSYLTRKRVRAHGVRFGEGFLAVPLRDEIGGGIYSLQLIYDSHTTPSYMKKQGRNKTFIKNGRKAGCFHAISNGSLDGDGIALICEGYATGASLHLATGLPVFIAFDCGNLAPVVKRIMQLYPALHLVIAADDDRWKENNAGVKKAHEAANNKHSVVLPIFAPQSLEHKPTDFNDLHILEGLHVVKDQWQQALSTLSAGGVS